MNAISLSPRSGRPLAALCMAGAMLLSACTTVVREPAPAHVVYREMPAPIVETVPPPPSAGLHWVPGHWVWREGRWHWDAGRYVATAVPPMPAPQTEVITVAPSPAHVWVRGHWRWGGSGWVWVKGMWVLA